jgi:hypothetical protein
MEARKIYGLIDGRISSDNFWYLMNQAAIKLDIEKRKNEGVAYETLVEKINPMPSLIYIPREFTEEYNGHDIV